ncbi:hypothetical protein JTB14_006341 [Gonioctena quinquepunctata]|nr:hypothetical protein JTB14_006341 [Gonioctena quinquepunctata]
MPAVKYSKKTYKKVLSIFFSVRKERGQPHSNFYCVDDKFQMQNKKAFVGANPIRVLASVAQFRQRYGKHFDVMDLELKEISLHRFDDLNSLLVEFVFIQGTVTPKLM